MHEILCCVGLQLFGAWKLLLLFFVKEQCHTRVDICIIEWRIILLIFNIPIFDTLLIMLASKLSGVVRVGDGTGGRGG